MIIYTTKSSVSLYPLPSDDYYYLSNKTVSYVHPGGTYTVSLICLSARVDASYGADVLCRGSSAGGSTVLISSLGLKEHVGVANILLYDKGRPRDPADKGKEMAVKRAARGVYGMSASAVGATQSLDRHFEPSLSS